MIVDTSAFWLWIRDVLLPILTLVGFAWLVYQSIKVRPILKFGTKLMRQWGTFMVQKREGKRIAAKLTEDQKNARKKLAESIRSKVPLGLLNNMKDNEIMAMLTDQDLMKGMIFLGESGSSVIKWIVNKVAPTEQKKKKLGLLQAPEIR